MQRITDTIRPAASAGDALMRALRSFGLLRESGVGMIGAAIIAFWVLVALFAPLLAPFEPNATLMPFAKPGAQFGAGGTFLLGTDQIGRDILSRIIWGSRTVLIYAPLATLSAYIVGILMGVVAGYRRGWWDVVLSRISDVMCQWRSKKGPPRRCKKGPLGGCGLVPVVHGRAPRATRRALNRLTRRRAREGPVGPRGQAWAGWSVQLAVGV